VETKSSPPKNIHQDVIAGFLNRINILQPDLAIFLVDTHLRLEDKINQMFKWELESRSGENFSRPTVPQRLRKGVFHLGRDLYVINSKPDLTVNLRTCLRYFLNQTLE